MALKVELKAGERLALGAYLLVNEGARTRLCIEGDVPVLREKDIMTAERADTPAKRLYLVVQTFYLFGNREAFDADYASVRGELTAAAPDAAPILESVEEWIAAGQFYKAMKEARRLACAAEPVPAGPPANLG